MSRIASAAIIDPSRLLGEALARLLTEELGVAVLAVSASLATGLDQLRATHPDVALLRHNTPANEDLEAVASMREISPAIRIVLLAEGPSHLVPESWRRAGVCACLPADATIADAEKLFKSLLTDVGASAKRAAGPQKREPREPVCGSATSAHLSILTRRECEVVKHLSQGHTIREVADLMRLSIKTVDAHKTKIAAKLGIHDRATLTRFAIRERLIPVWESAERSERSEPRSAPPRERAR